MTKKRLFMDINVGIGDHLVLRMFLDGVKDQYDQIAITHSRPGMAFWHNNNPARWDFNLKLGRLLFSEPPYVLMTNIFYPFYPNERIVKEINNKPIKPNLNCLCVGKSLDINNYVVITTKIREFPKSIFEQMKSKITAALQKLSENCTIVIIGEREVQRTKEYEAECNRNQVFGIYDYLKTILPPNKVLDLTIPALGIIPSTLPQVQQDCLIMKEAKAVITFGLGGNVWMSACTANKTIGLRADKDWIVDLIQTSDYPDLFLTKDVDQFTKFLEELH